MIFLFGEVEKYIQSRRSLTQTDSKQQSQQVSEDVLVISCFFCFGRKVPVNHYVAWVCWAHFGHRTGHGLVPSEFWCQTMFVFFWFCWVAPPVVAEIRERFKMHPETKKRFTWWKFFTAAEKKWKKSCMEGFFSYLSGVEVMPGFVVGFFWEIPVIWRGFSVHLPPSLPRRTESWGEGSNATTASIGS